MPRFRLVGATHVVFDDGGMNLLSTEALLELTGVVARLPGYPVAEGPFDHPTRFSDRGIGVHEAIAPTGESGLTGQVTGQPGNRATIFTFSSGRPGLFAAGADMAEMRAFTPFEAEGFARLGQELFEEIERLPMLTVALIDGDCFGGALDLVLSFDLRFATPRSRFAHPGGRIGIVTGFGGTSRWRKVLTRPAANRLFLENRILTAGEALAAGLVDRVADDHQAELARLEALDPAVTAMVKQLTNAASRLSREELLLLASRLARVAGC